MFAILHRFGLMPKEKIAIISVLKPVDDIRSYHKMAKSLLATGKYELHLIGFYAQTRLTDTEDCHFQGHGPFHRLSLKRLFVPLTILWKLIRIKPKQVICNSPELLWVSTVTKILLRAKIIYDVQENYRFNLWFQSVYPTPIKQILGLLVRAVEYVNSIFIDHFILAEKCYAGELGFVGSRFTILENKSLRNKDFVLSSNKSFDLLFSGTVTVSNGVLNALKFWKRLREYNSSLTFKIIGHCSDQKLYSQLQSLDEDGLHLEISKNPVPYQNIIEAMLSTRFGLVLYDLNPSNERCLPTKVFDYLTYQLPIIYEDGAGWQSFIENNHGGITINHSSLDESSLLEQMHTFRVDRINDTAGLWEDEANRLIELIDTN